MSNYNPTPVSVNLKSAMTNLSIAIQTLRNAKTNGDSLSEIWQAKSLKDAHFSLDYLVAAIGTAELLESEIKKANEKANQSSEN